MDIILVTSCPDSEYDNLFSGIGFQVAHYGCALKISVMPPSLVLR
jgi:hypothetical protein